MGIRWAAVLLLFALGGCAAGAPKVEIVEMPAPPASSPPVVEPAENAAPTPVDRPSSMTEVLAGRGIPDRVENDGRATIWIYDGSEGTEYLSFVKGKLRDRRLVTRKP